jgi:hypothetical protein
MTTEEKANKFKTLQGLLRQQQALRATLKQCSNEQQFARLLLEIAYKGSGTRDPYLLEQENLNYHDAHNKYHNAHAKVVQAAEDLSTLNEAIEAFRFVHRKTEAERLQDDFSLNNLKYYAKGKYGPAK